MKKKLINDYFRTVEIVNGENTDNKIITRTQYRENGNYSEYAYTKEFGSFSRFKNIALSGDKIEDTLEEEFDDVLIDRHTKMYKMQNTISQLKKQNKKLFERYSYKTDIENIVESIVKDKINVNIKKYKKEKSKKPSDDHAILIASDFHYGSVIKASTMNYQNEFDTDIANKRIDHLFDEYIKYIQKNNIQNSHIVSLGDQISGSKSHMDLAISNDKYDTEATHEIAEKFIDFIINLSQIQDKVYYYCYVGNHARLSKERTNKSKITENLEYLLGKIVEQTIKVLQKNNICKNIVVKVPDSPYTIENINGMNILFTHGDTMLNTNKGVRVMKNLTTMAQGFKQLDTDFDLAVCGHFHSFAVYTLNKRKLIINSSLCGPDEYASSLGIMSNEASQTILKISENKLDEIKLIEF